MQNGGSVSVVDVVVKRDELSQVDAFNELNAVTPDKTFDILYIIPT
jgi:hypothetical protein